MSDAFWMAMFGFLATALNILISRKSNATSKQNQEVLQEVRENVNGNLTRAVNEAKDEARRNPTPRVLVIDDDPNDVAYAVRILKNFGIICFEAHNAVQAESLLMSNIGPGRGYPFDFVLLDLRMPGTSTADIFRTFNEKAPRVPIVILTGQPGAEDGKDLSDKPRIWIIKPLTATHVKSLLDQFSLPYPKALESNEAALI